MTDPSTGSTVDVVADAGAAGGPPGAGGRSEIDGGTASITGSDPTGSGMTVGSAPTTGGGPGPVFPATKTLIGDGNPALGIRSLDVLHGVEMTVTVELGRTRLFLRDLLALRSGSIIELDRAAGSPVDVLINGTLLAHGEVVVVDDEFGVRITDIVSGDDAQSSN